MRLNKMALLVLAVASLTSGAMAGRQTYEHQEYFEHYEGTATCLECHEEEAESFFHSQHYQWQGEAPDIEGADGRKLGKMNTLEILWNGVHRIQTWSRIKEAVGGLDSIYQAVEGTMGKLNLPISHREANLLRFCINPVSVGEICDTLPGNNFELCRTIWAFHVMGAMRKVETAS